MNTFELVTLSGIKFGDEVYEVQLPTPDGLIGIFPHHMPIVSLVDPGVISIRRRETDHDDVMEHYAIHGGVVEINGKRIRVLVDEADHSDEVSEQEAQDALKRAEATAKSATDQVSLDKAHTLIQRHRSQLRVAELRKRKRRR